MKLMAATAALGLGSLLVGACGSDDIDNGEAIEDSYLSHKDITIKGQEYMCIIFEGYEEGGLWCERENNGQEE